MTSYLPALKMDWVPGIHLPAVTLQGSHSTLNLIASHENEYVVFLLSTLPGRYEEIETSASSKHLTNTEQTPRRTYARTKT